MADMRGVAPCRFLGRLWPVDGQSQWLNLGFVVLIVAGIASLDLTLSLLVVTFGLAFFVLHGATRKERAAALARTLDTVAALPDDYVVFNQTDFPDPRGGTYTADVLVASPQNVVFLLSVQRIGGSIRGAENAAKWRSCWGILPLKEFANPIWAMKRRQHQLSTLFQGAHRPWVQAIVVFADPGVKLAIRGTTSIPCMSLSALDAYLPTYAGRGSLSPSSVDVLASYKSQGDDARHATLHGPLRQFVTQAAALGLAALAATATVRLGRALHDAIVPAPSASEVHAPNAPSAAPSR